METKSLHKGSVVTCIYAHTGINLKPEWILDIEAENILKLLEGYLKTIKIIKQIPQCYAHLMDVQYSMITIDVNSNILDIANEVADRMGIRRLTLMDAMRNRAELGFR